MATATVVKERPILFRGEMVRAILDGRKTQTRRVYKGAYFGNNAVAYPDSGKGSCPYGQPGDRLWVREAWWRDWREDGVVVYDATPEFGKYENTGEVVRSRCPDGHLPTREECRAAMLPKFWSKKSSIFMPRWASRLTLEVIDVRAEKLNRISDEDAIAEGAKKFPTGYVFEGTGYDKAGLCHNSPSIAFACLYDEIHGDGSWDANPWVWVVEFKKV